MRAIRFDKSPLNAFVQSSCFARNKAQGWRVYWGAKQWGAVNNASSGGIIQPSFTAQFDPTVPFLSTLYLYETEDAGGGTTRYHWEASVDRYGNGPRFTDLGSMPSTFVVDIFGGSEQRLYSSVGQTGSHPPPGGLTGFGDPLGTGNRLEVTMGDTLYQVKVYGPAGDPSEQLLDTYTFILGAPYSMADAFGEAITAARGGPAIGGQQGKSGCYNEAGGGTQFGERGPFVPIGRSPFNIAEFWYVGWKDRRDALSPNRAAPWPRSFDPPDASDIWTGAQIQTTFPITDGAFLGDPATPTFTNPHGGYLVSFFAPPLVTYGSFTGGLVQVVCSTISGSGALATYRLIPELNNPYQMVSVQDVIFNNTDINPAFFSPTKAAGVAATWQVFFPGKKASDIKRPQDIWAP